MALNLKNITDLVNQLQNSGQAQQILDQVNPAPSYHPPSEGTYTAPPPPAPVQYERVSPLAGGDPTWTDHPDTSDHRKRINAWVRHFRWVNTPPQESPPLDTRPDDIQRAFNRLRNNNRPPDPRSYSQKIQDLMNAPLHPLNQPPREENPYIYMGVGRTPVPSVPSDFQFFEDGTRTYWDPGQRLRPAQEPVVPTSPRTFDVDPSIGSALQRLIAPPATPAADPYQNLPSSSQDVRFEGNPFTRLQQDARHLNDPIPIDVGMPPVSDRITVDDMPPPPAGYTWLIDPVTHIPLLVPEPTPAVRWQ